MRDTPTGTFADRGVPFPLAVIGFPACTAKG
jgi:hypothetical protein